jgi:hypothetical protein
VREVLRTALERAPERRYRDAAQFLAALEQAASRRYGPAWWTEAGLGALATSSSAALIAAGLAAAPFGGSGEVLAGSGTSAGGPGPAHLVGSAMVPPPRAEPKVGRTGLRRKGVLVGGIVTAVVAVAVVGAVVALGSGNDNPKPHRSAVAQPPLPGLSTVSSPTPPSSSATSAPSPSSPTTSPTTSPNAPGRLDGTWKGTYASQKYAPATGTFTVVFRQRGSTISGAITIQPSCLTRGTVDGRLTGNTIDFGAVRGQSRSVSFTGRISGRRMSGTYHSDASCGSDNGTWTAARS